MLPAIYHNINAELVFSAYYNPAHATLSYHVKMFATNGREKYALLRLGDENFLRWKSAGERLEAIPWKFFPLAYPDEQPSVTLVLSGDGRLTGSVKEGASQKLAHQALLALKSLLRDAVAPLTVKSQEIDHAALAFCLRIEDDGIKKIYPHWSLISPGERCKSLDLLVDHCEGLTRINIEEESWLGCHATYHSVFGLRYDAIAFVYRDDSPVRLRVQFDSRHRRTENILHQISSSLNSYALEARKLW